MSLVDDIWQQPLLDIGKYLTQSIQKRGTYITFSVAGFLSV